MSNQAGIAEDLLTDKEFEIINHELLKLLEPSGIKIPKTYYCPHGERSTCNCRKPKPGLLMQAAKEFAIDLPLSWMIEDRPTDIEAGINAGTKTIFVESGAVREPNSRASYSVRTLVDACNIIYQQA